jgi:hypothetical protein
VRLISIGLTRFFMALPGLLPSYPVIRLSFHEKIR